MASTFLTFNQALYEEAASNAVSQTRYKGLDVASEGRLRFAPPAGSA
jgi:hypothetical protein